MAKSDHIPAGNLKHDQEHFANPRGYVGLAGIELGATPEYGGRVTADVDNTHKLEAGKGDKLIRKSFASRMIGTRHDRHGKSKR